MIRSAPVSGSTTRTNGPVTQPMSVPTITPLGGTMISSLSVLFEGSGSYSVAETVAVFVSVPPVGLVTFAKITRVGVSAVVTLPTVQMPVPASYPPTDGVADTNVSPTGRMSWTSTLVAVSVPRLSTAIVYSIVSPIDGSLLFTVLKTSRSACFGVTEDVPVLFSG